MAATPETDARIQIYATFHRDYPLNRHCHWIQPVAVGHYENPAIVARDNQGVNIADLNPYYCEITTAYWALYNTRSDYVGFCHYRRYFDFRPVPLGQEIADPIAHVTSEAQLTALRLLLGVTDIVVTARESYGETISQQYLRWHLAGEWAGFMEAIRRVHPAQARYLRYFDVATSAPTRSMFVMTWERFNAYMLDLLPVLEVAFKLQGLTGIPERDRYPGFLAERYLGFWLFVNQLRFIEVPLLNIPEPAPVPAQVAADGVAEAVAAVQVAEAVVPEPQAIVEDEPQAIAEEEPQEMGETPPDEPPADAPSHGADVPESASELPLVAENAPEEAHPAH
jgi:hypothetical protein